MRQAADVHAELSVVLLMWAGARGGVWLCPLPRSRWYLILARFFLLSALIKQLELIPEFSLNGDGEPVPKQPEPLLKNVIILSWKNQSGNNSNHQTKTKKGTEIKRNLDLTNDQKGQTEILSSMGLCYFGLFLLSRLIISVIVDFVKCVLFYFHFFTK